jgi:hypothetical protein
VSLRSDFRFERVEGFGQCGAFSGSFDCANHDGAVTRFAQDDESGGHGWEV